MRIKVIQKIIDKIRRKKIKYIIGNNNKIFIKDNNEYLLKNLGESIHITGNNNIIKFVSNKLKKFPTGLRIDIYGNNNYIEIHEPNFWNSFIYVTKDNNKFIMQKPYQTINGAGFHLGDGGIIEIEKDVELGNSSLWIVVNGDYKGSHKLFIGEGTHIAKDAIIRTSDGECLLDYKTCMPISEPQDVYIGRHCWITSRCTILKGAYIPNNTIVGANSLVNKKFKDEYTLIAGVPAKVIKEKVRWNEGSYASNMQRYENHNDEKSIKSV